MSRTVLSFDPEGLRRRLVDMERQLADLQRRGSWQFDGEVVATAGSSSLNAAALLVLEASSDSIGTGGDLVAFSSTVYRHRFDEVAPGAQAIIWPTTAVGEIQVEFAWDTYTSGGKIEIEVDGVVPAWGVIADGTDGQSGCKRRSVHIDEGAEVSIRVTQASGSAKTANVWVEFTIPDPTGTSVSSGVMKLADAFPATASPASGHAFVSNVGLSFFWSGTGTLILASDPDGASGVAVDDILELDVTHADSSTSSYSYNWNPSCGISDAAFSPDVTAHFEAGLNTVDVTCRDWCGPTGTMSCPDIYLVQVP